MGFEIKCNKCGATMQLVGTLDNGDIEFAWYEDRISIVCLECCDNYFTNQENYNKFKKIIDI